MRWKLSLTELRSGLMKYTPKPVEGNVNISHTHPIKELLLLCGGVLAIVLATYFLLGLAVDYAAPYIPREFEEKIADKFISLPTVNSNHTGYLQSLSEKLSKNTPTDAGPIIVKVADMDIENAFALPGGRIYLSRGLLQKVKSENELAMVLAHEMAHCANRDNLRSLGRGLVMALVASLFVKDEDAVQYFIGTSMTLGHLTYSRHWEKRADLYALKTITTTYGHGGGATDFFRRMKDDKDRQHPPEYLSTHPAPKRRLGYLEDGVADFGDPDNTTLTALPKWWDEWRQRDEEPF